jgi:hypothetical protein
LTRILEKRGFGASFIWYLTSIQQAGELLKKTPHEAGFSARDPMPVGVGGRRLGPSPTLSG